MTNRPWIGALSALVAGSARWVRWRWDFDDADVSRSWRLSIVLLLFAAVLIWLDGARHRALPMLLSWMPLLMMPVQFVQSFGMRGPLPLGAFSLVAGLQRARNERYGMVGEPRFVDFGHLMIPCCIVAASVGPHADTAAFLPSVIALVGWHLAALGTGARNPWLAPMVVVIGIAAWQGDNAVRSLGEWLGRRAGTITRGFDPNLNLTLIGVTGRLTPNPEMLWRISPDPGSPPPRLLRTATFNTFTGTHWQNQRHAATDFKDLDTRLIDGEAYWMVESRYAWEQRASGIAVDAPELNPPTAMPSFRLRGTVAAETPLPLPGDCAAVSGFELDGIERNTFGTVRIYPKDPVIDGRVHWKGATDSESPPIPSEDLRMPLAERKTARRVLNELGLRSDDPLTHQLAVIRRWFLTAFTYSHELGIRHRSEGAIRTTALTRFLTQERIGHCEYFATAATLLMRELGVPARYATGFAVAEHNPMRGEFIIRRSHGHAWCRVWDAHAGRWLDFDTTPPNWLASASPKMTATQRFNDRIKRVREDFFIWRQRPEQRTPVTIAMIMLSLAFTSWIAQRLWQSRQRLADEPKLSTKPWPNIRTPLHDLEDAATRHLGIRPTGLPYAQWLSNLGAVMPDIGINRACALHQQMRFDPAGAEPASQDHLESLAADIARRLNRLEPTSNPLKMPSRSNKPAVAPPDNHR